MMSLWSRSPASSLVSEGLFELTVVGPIITTSNLYLIDSSMVPDMAAVVHYPTIAPEAPNYPTIVAYETVGYPLPEGVALNPVTGEITGSAFCYQWSSEFEVRATDSAGQSTTKTFSVDQCT